MLRALFFNRDELAGGQDGHGAIKYREVQGVDKVLHVNLSFMRSRVLEKHEIDHYEYQGDADVYQQAFHQVIPKEQYIYCDDDGYH
ncbi:MAG TPA: hypothetical protein VHD60_02140 [Candidatus Saccharimonadales bacterium]|nr:hypothetical protein [Candidatus Saccharimonadales bacterium]